MHSRFVGWIVLGLLALAPAIFARPNFYVAPKAVRWMADRFANKPAPRLFRKFDRFQRRPIATVTQIDQHALFIQARNELAPEDTQTSISRLETAVTDQVPAIVSKKNNPHPKILDEIEPI